MFGNELLCENSNWKFQLKKFQGLNWARTNKLWIERCFNKGRMDHSVHSALLTLNALKKHLGLPLSVEQQKIEDKFFRNKKMSSPVSTPYSAFNKTWPKSRLLLRLLLISTEFISSRSNPMGLSAIAEGKTQPLFCSWCGRLYKN